MNEPRIKYEAAKAQNSGEAESDNPRIASPLVSIVLMLSVFVLPVTLIVSGLVSFRWRYELLVGVSVAVSIILVWRRIRLDQLGLKWRNGRETLLLNTLVAILIVVALLAIDTTDVRRTDNQHTISFYLFYLAVSAPLQEFLYRSFLFKLIRDSGITGQLPTIVLASILFSYLHVIYRDWLTCAFTLVMGLIWCTIYWRTKNVYGTIASHTVLGIATIWLRLI